MRQVMPAESAELARLIHVVGLDDNPNADRIASVIRSTTRSTLVETADDGTLIGFIDAFMTVSWAGYPRWEVDLIGVHPDYRGRGIAQRLIQASIAIGREQGVCFFRALIHLDNIASANAFRRCGFIGATPKRELYISDTPIDAPFIPPRAAHLIPVCTLTYSGIWIENDRSAQSFAAARAIRTKYDWFIAGVLLPTGTPMPESFAHVGTYRWWSYKDELALLSPQDKDEG